jgi:hypothetical protein
MEWLDRLLGRAYPAEATASTAVIDEALARARRGDLREADLAATGAAFGRLYEAFCAWQGTRDNTKFGGDARGRFYVEAVKMTALGHPDHSAWPLMSGLRGLVLPALQARMARASDSWLRLAAIQPALRGGRLDAALALHAEIRDDPFLSRLAVQWASSSRMAFAAWNDVPAVETFLERLGVPAWPADADPGEAWPLLASPYPFFSDDPHTGLPDPRPLGAVRAELASHWEISDRGSAIRVLQWLRDEGHGAQVRAGLERPSTDDPAPRAVFLRANAIALARHHIRAWDLCRGISVARAAHKARWLTDGEAWEFVRESGESLRSEYDSWAAMGDDYGLGLRWFRPTTDSDPYLAMLRWLQRDPRSPWRIVPWRR